MPQIVDRRNKTSAKSQLIEYVRNAIRATEFKPGDKLPTTAEFVQRAGVSSNTVRQAMAELIREGVLRATPGQGTFVVSDDEKREKQRDSQVQSIALYSAFRPGMGLYEKDRFRAESVKGFVSGCEQYGVFAVMLPNNVAAGPPEKLLQKLNSIDCQGLVWLYPEPQDWIYIDHLLEYNFPIVITRRSQYQGDIAVVGANYDSAGFTVGEFFVDSGCDRVVLFNHSTMQRETSIDIRRHGELPLGIEQGLAKAYALERGDDASYVDVHNLQGFTSKETQKMVDVLSTVPQSHGLVFTNTYHLFNLLLSEEVKARGLLQDRKLCTVGNPTFLIHLLPHIDDLDLHVLVDPFKELAHCATQKLLALINGYLSHTTTLVNIEFKRFQDLDVAKLSGLETGTVEPAARMD